MTFRSVGLMLTIVSGFCCLTFTSGASVIDECQTLATAVQPVKTFFANTYTDEATSLDETALNQICSGEDDIETLKTECQDEVIVIDFENYAHFQTYLCSTAGRDALGDLHHSQCLGGGFHLGQPLAECADMYNEQANVEGQFCNALKAWFECTRARLAQICDEAYANVTMNLFLSLNLPLGAEAMRPCRNAQ